MTTDLAGRVRATWPYERVTVAGYTNSQLSYVPSRAVLHAARAGHELPVRLAEENYEGGVSFAWYGHRGPLALHAETMFLDGHRTLLDVGWTHIGHATQVVGLASWDGRLYAVTANDKLWWRPPVHDDVAWHELGHAIDVTALTACDGALFCTTAGGRLWRRPLHGVDVPWEPLGNAPSVVAMTTVGSMLYAATSDGRLLRRDPVAGNVAVGRPRPRSARRRPGFASRACCSRRRPTAGCTGGARTPATLRGAATATPSSSSG